VKAAELVSPRHVYRIAANASPWFGISSGVVLGLGLVSGLALAPADYLQGDGFRIIYVHVPAAYLSLLAYCTTACAAGVGFVWRIKVAHGLAISSASLGAGFTAIALATGSIWGKPMWGTYWQWTDTRLVSEFLLLLLFLGYLACRASFDDRDKADRMSAVLALVGLINVPIIHFSVEWWGTLHQGPTIAKFGKPSITTGMLVPLLIMILAFSLFYLWLLLKGLQSDILEREGGARWTHRLVEK
jgi:heme exporter protein C